MRMAAPLNQHFYRLAPGRLTRLSCRERRARRSMRYVIDILDTNNAVDATNKHYFLST